MPSKSHSADPYGFEPSRSGAHDLAQAQPGDADAERSGRPSLTEGNRATGAGRHAADDRKSTEAAPETTTDEEEEIHISEKMIGAGIEALELSYSSDGHRDDARDIVESVFRAMSRESRQS
jgi:hypothetical protein